MNFRMLRRWLLILSPICLLLAIITGALWSSSQTRWHELSLLHGRRYFALSAGNRLRLGVEIRRINSSKTNQLIPDTFSPTWTTFFSHGPFTPEPSIPLIGATQIGRASVLQGHIEDYTQHIFYFPHWLAIALLGAVPILSIVLTIRQKPAIPASRLAPTPPSEKITDAAPASSPAPIAPPTPTPAPEIIVPAATATPAPTTELDPLPLAPPTASVPLADDDHTFIESLEDEPFDAWHSAVIEILKLLSPQIPPSWTTFIPGPTLDYAGRRLLSLRTPAGSITPLLYNYAQRHAIPRALIIIIRQRNGSRIAHAWIDGVKSTFNATPLFASAAPSPQPSEAEAHAS